MYSHFYPFKLDDLPTIKKNNITYQVIAEPTVVLSPHQFPLNNSTT